MRIIDYYNYIATAAYILIGVGAVFVCKKRPWKDVSDSFTGIAFVLIMILAAFLRFFNLGSLPAGLNQDEASIGYEAFAIAKYGIDRNGFPNPIYPITWGCGGGSPLLIYLNVISIKLFGTGVFKLRFIPAFLGTCSVALFFFILREIYGYGGKRDYKNISSIVGAFFLAICPWHVILSRWSLDSNIMPFTFALAAYLFMLGIRTGKTLVFVFSAALYAVNMYSYGSATIVIPLHLLCMIIICYRTRIISIKQILCSFAAFMVIFMPLFVFYGVNYLGFPEVFTNSFTINKFTASRTGEAFVSLSGNPLPEIWNNFKTFVKVATIGDDSDMLCHFIPGYATLFEFTFPITLIGIIFSVKELFSKSKDNKEKAEDFVWISALFANVIMALFVISDISRDVMLFLPLVYFFVRGCYVVAEKNKRLLALVILLFTFSGAFFARDYFKNFNSYTVSIFMPGYGDAIKRAYEVSGDERTIYSTYDGLSAPFMLALYYTDYDPNLFYKTVEYKDPKAEFRIAKSFGNFVFELPEDILSSENEDGIFVLSSRELDALGDISGYTLENFGGYQLIYKAK